MYKVKKKTQIKRKENMISKGDDRNKENIISKGDDKSMASLSNSATLLNL